MPTYLLVHGAFHGSWTWTHILPQLQSAGHTVLTPTLPGVGERFISPSSPQFSTQAAINLQTHITEIMSTINTKDLSNVILVGHSYAGMVVAGVVDQLSPADRRRIRRVVHIDSIFPWTADQQDGKGPAASMLDVLGPEKKAAFVDGMGETGLVCNALPPGYFEVYGQEAEWLKPKLTGHPVGCFLQKLTLKCGQREMQGLGRTYVLCERHISAQAGMAEGLRGRGGWRVLSGDWGHDCMLTAPEEVGRLLLAEAEVQG